MYDIYGIQYLVIYISNKLYATFAIVCSTFAAMLSKYFHYKIVYDLYSPSMLHIRQFTIYIYIYIYIYIVYNCIVLLFVISIMIYATTKLKDIGFITTDMT